MTNDQYTALLVCVICLLGFIDAVVLVTQHPDLFNAPGLIQ